MSTRDLKLGQLHKIRTECKSFEAQAANASTLIEIKNSAIKRDLSKLDVEGILQAAKDLHEAVVQLRAGKQLADELSAELYD